MLGHNPCTLILYMMEVNTTQCEKGRNTNIMKNDKVQEGFPG